jgi:hypothetical protein
LRRSSSRPTDWAARFVEAQHELDHAPPGWLTIDEWAARIGRMHWTAAKLLRRAEADGCARFKMYRPKAGRNISRPQAHWWLDGVSDEIARGEGKKKGGGYMRPRK